MPQSAPRDPTSASLAKRADSATEARFTVKYAPGGELGAAISDIGWFREVSGLSMEIEVLEYPEGGTNDFALKLPGRVKYPNLVLKAGVMNVDALQKWVGKVGSSKTGSANTKGVMTVQLVNNSGQPVRTWAFKGAFPVKWTGPNLNTSSNNNAVETLEVAHEGLSLGT